jgi:hypothetical protein
MLLIRADDRPRRRTRRRLACLGIALAALLLPSASGFGAVASALPSTTVTTGPPKATQSTSAAFTFTSDDPGARFACALDRGAFQRCTSPWAYEGIADGRHTFFAIAVGVGGIDPTPAAWVWTVDRVPPADVTRLQAHVVYGRLDLTWRFTPASGAARVVVLRSTNVKRAAQTRVYSGSGSSYTDARFSNGAFHRYKIVTADEAGNASRGIDVVVRPSALLLTPKEGAKLTAPPALRWRRVPKATYYNVQLFRGNRKVLSAWPVTSRLNVGRQWSYGGRRQALRPGLYTWYVWPGLGPRVRGIYGDLVGQSSFSVG